MGRGWWCGWGASVQEVGYWSHTHAHHSATLSLGHSPMTKGSGGTDPTTTLTPTIAPTPIPTTTPILTDDDGVQGPGTGQPPHHSNTYTHPHHHMAPHR